MREGLNQIVEAIKVQIKAAWGVTDATIYVGEDKVEKAGPNRKYAAIVWESVDAENGARYTEFRVSPLYVVYVGPPPSGKKGADAKTSLVDPVLDRLKVSDSIILELQGVRYDDDWGDATKLVTVVLEFSALWHEIRTVPNEFTGSGNVLAGSAVA